MGSLLFSDETLNASFTEDGLARMLQQLADSVGAEGATLTYSHRHTPLGAITSEGLRAYVAPYLSPDRPFDPRQGRVNPTLGEGFRLDQDDFDDDEIARDPYYQEFLRPLGFAWHACAALTGSPGGDALSLTLRRTLRQGRFEQEQLEGLAAQLPLVRATAWITQRMGGLSGAASDASDDERRSLFGFDAAGRAFVVHQGRQASDLLAVRSGRLVASSRQQQAQVQATIDRANAQALQTSSILTDEAGEWWLLSVVPASAAVTAGMTPFISWAALVPFRRSGAADLRRTRRLEALFGLSPAEARVAALIGEARTVSAAARLLSTSPGTVRNQLKVIFNKIGVNRQAELVAILSQL